MTALSLGSSHEIMSLLSKAGVTMWAKLEVSDAWGEGQPGQCRELGQHPAALSTVTEHPKPPCWLCPLGLSIFTTDTAQTRVSPSLTVFQVSN